MTTNGFADQPPVPGTFRRTPPKKLDANAWRELYEQYEANRKMGLMLLEEVQRLQRLREPDISLVLRAREQRVRHDLEVMEAEWARERTTVIAEANARCQRAEADTLKVRAKLAALRHAVATLAPDVAIHLGIKPQKRQPLKLKKAPKSKE